MHASFGLLGLRQFPAEQGILRLRIVCLIAEVHTRNSRRCPGPPAAEEKSLGLRALVICPANLDSGNVGVV
jgi:hypothetical protein